MQAGLKAYLACATLAIAASSPAAANGRFPATTGVHFADDDPNLVIVPVTFGLLLSVDGGITFSWVCEDAIGYGGTFDPDFSASAGAIYATTFRGLRRTDDGGCTWELVEPFLEDTWVADVETASDGSVWVSTATTAKANDVFVNRNDGAGFVSTGLSTTTGWWRSLAAAPNDPLRLYVTGYEVNGDGGSIPAVHLRRTDNAGLSWNALALDDFDFGSQPQLFVEAVSPINSSIVFARAAGAAKPGDILYRSGDAGMSWVEVLRTTDTMTGIVARSDGSTIIASTVNDGVRISSTGGLPGSFVEVPSPPRMACIAERANGNLFACGANWEPDNFALGHSLDGASWTKVMRFEDLKGPLDCAATTPQSTVCVQERWPGICEQLGICTSFADAGPRLDEKKSNGCGCSFAAAIILFWPRRRRRSRL